MSYVSPLPNRQSEEDGFVLDEIGFGSRGYGEEFEALK